MLQYLDLPSELDSKCMHMEIISNDRLLVERHHGVISIDYEAIRFRTENGIASVRGTELLMQQLKKDAFLVEGCISAVLLEEKS